MSETFEGGCTCRHVRYRLMSRPMFVNCCHCRWCQRETGSAFVINAVIETDRVEMLAGEVEVEGALPRPAGFRVTEGFRRAAETVSTLLARGMEAAA